jgi:ubiquinone/menaquinone biosynthesis C-methylase UbiE
MTNHQLKSYAAHNDHYKEELTNPDRLKVGQSWFREDTTNYWVHSRMFEGAIHLLSAPEKTWLTVGDGRYGLDSIILKRKGWTHVLPTDISGHLLEKAHEEGLIQDYRVENAEALSFDDNQFDYVFCKESYHHFPRPMIALYEMLRVAQEGVLVVEPWDTVQSGSLHAKLRRIKRGLKRVFTQWGLKLKERGEDLLEKLSHLDRQQHIDAGRYEESTNYIYGITPREWEKVALGLNYPTVAFKGINDSYQVGCEFEVASFKNKLYRRMRFTCWKNNFLCKLRIKDYTMLTAFIFKKQPTSQVVSQLRKAGWQVVDLPRNPYA